MILKLKEIHHYTHQLVSSDSEDEAPSAGRAALMKPPASSSVAAGNGQFKEPRAPAAPSPLKHNREEQAELLSASQGSNTSSTAASEESERYRVFRGQHFNRYTFVLLLCMFSETPNPEVLSEMWNTCMYKTCKIHL